jgi:CDP-6-deoxy-D-xylo-4-hexulose-3-dehydrase
MIPKIGYQIGVGNANISDQEKKYVNEALDSNRLSPGKFTKAFEEGFAEAHDSKYGVMCNSGTSALRVAIATLAELNNWEEGAEIIVPALTFVATANVVIDAKFTPVFVDIDPQTYNIDPAKIEAVITDKTVALMPVHLFGLPCEMDPIMELAQKHNLKVIEDSCETMFATYKGRPVGSFGDMSCFSTYMAHLLTTGVGGVILTNDEEMKVISKSLINHGRDPIYITMDDDKTDEEERFKRIIERRFRFIRPGFSFRITEMEAALGVGQLEQKDRILGDRQKNADRLIKGLEKYSEFLQLPTWPEHSTHAFMMFPIVVKEPVNKMDFVVFLEKNNIETRDMVPLTNQPIYTEQFGADFEDQFPNAKVVNQRGFYIGCYQDLTDEELDYVIAKMGEYFGMQFPREKCALNQSEKSTAQV